MQFSIVPLIASILVNLNYKLDVFLLKYFSTETSIGLYSIAVAFVSYSMIFPDIFKEVLYSRSAKEKGIKSVLLSLKISNLSLLVASILYIIIGKKLLVFIYGEQYLQSFDIVFILLISMFGLSIFKIITPYLISIGKNSVRLKILILAVTINLILNIILIPSYEIIGAAIATMVSYNITGICILLYFVRISNTSLKETMLINKNDLYIFKQFIKELKK